MGYSTDFEGSFKFDKPLDDGTYSLLVGLASTRRVKRRVGPEYGDEGEFWCEDLANFGQNKHPNKIDDSPPGKQPGLWLQWIPTDDRTALEWDGNEKFYNYVEWLEYLIAKIFSPRGYVLNGEVEWVGESRDDWGKIEVKDNLVSVKHANISFD